MKKFFAVLLTVCLVGVLFTGCSGSAKGNKNHLNVAVELFPNSLEPATDWEAWYDVRFGVGETLIRYDDKGGYQPWLAESWKVADDKITWTFNIRKGVKFSNGKEMKASDVVASIERLFKLQDPANGGKGNPQSHFTYSAIKANDEAMTVTIVTTKPTPDLLGCLAYPWTMVIDVADSDKRNVATQGPIGTGPYAFKSFAQNSDVQLVRNEHYWDGKVPFETVSVRKVEDPATRSMALQDGSVDMALNISPADLEVLEKTGKYTVKKVAGSRTGYAHINFNGVLKNDVLRKAVVQAIDAKTIAKSTTRGAYTYGFAPVPSSLAYGYDKLVDKYPYNVEAAKKALDEAKIVDGDGDKIRELDGKNIVLDYKVAANRSMDKIAEAQAAKLKEIGIGVKIEVTKNQSELLNSHAFDLITSNEVVTQTGDPFRFLEHWNSAAKTLNYASYKNEKYDALAASLKDEFDVKKRVEIMTQMQQILIDDAALLVFGYFNYNITTVNSLTGVNPNPNDFYWITKDIKFSK